MPVYKCKLCDENGHIIEKEIEAGDAAGLRKSLERDGWFVHSMSRTGFNLSSSVVRPKGKKIRTNEFLVFNQELAALLKAGLPLVSSLETLAQKEENLSFKGILNKVTTEVKEGTPLSNALETAPHVFNRLYVSSIRAGEKSGDLVTNILRFISFTKKINELKKKVVNASIYPVILLAVAMSVILFLLLYVVPSFSRIYLDAGAELPRPTLILITVTELVKNNIVLLMVLVLLLFFAFTAAIRFPTGKRTIDRLKISLPWIGDMIRKFSVAKFSRTLSTVLRSGFPLVSSLSLASGTLDNSFLEKHVSSAIKRVGEGESLANAMETTGIMPITALKMVLVGESSGALDDMFENIAELLEEEVDRKINIITSTIEPLLMLFMGLIVALIVTAMYLPIFKIAGAAT